MREIKFRAWNIKEERMIQNIQQEYDGREEDCFAQFIEQTGRHGREGEKGKYHVMQYTGLKDKNGVEIYEGDKIIFDNSDIGGERYKGIVEWNTDPTLDGLCFGLFIPPDIHGFSGWLSTDFLGDLEVVGNIYEGVDK